MRCDAAPRSRVRGGRRPRRRRRGSRARPASRGDSARRPPPGTRRRDPDRGRSTPCETGHPDRPARGGWRRRRPGPRWSGRRVRRRFAGSSCRRPRISSRRPLSRAKRRQASFTAMIAPVPSRTAAMAGSPSMARWSASLDRNARIRLGPRSGVRRFFVPNEASRSVHAQVKERRGKRLFAPEAGYFRGIGPPARVPGPSRLSGWQAREHHRPVDRGTVTKSEVRPIRDPGRSHGSFTIRSGGPVQLDPSRWRRAHRMWRRRGSLGSRERGTDRRRNAGGQRTGGHVGHGGQAALVAAPGHAAVHHMRPALVDSRPRHRRPTHSSPFRYSSR